jgi:DNA-binding NarL/FixJ family response regulator
MHGCGPPTTNYDGFADNEPLAPRLAEGVRFIQIIERHEFVRDCWTMWMRAACPDFEILAAPDLHLPVERALFGRTAAVVVGSDTMEWVGQWLEGKLEQLRLRLPGVPVIAIVADDEVAKADVWVDRFGLSGYIPTSTNTEVASAALRLVMAGGTYFPRRQVHGRPSERIPVHPAPEPVGHSIDARLTPRERAVLDHLCQGSPNKVIAHKLNMSLSTVKAHIHSILNKTNARNRTELAMAARRGK